jgi:anti-sigma B factor antagonist
MPFSIERTADASTVRILDELAAADRPELRSAMLVELAAGVQTVRFDFADANYIDGAGLGLLVSLARLVREHTGELRLANLNEDLRTLFMLTKLDTLFTIEHGDDGGSADSLDPVAPKPAGPERSAAEERPRP